MHTESSDSASRAKEAWDRFDFDYGFKVSWRNIPVIYRSTRPYHDDATLQSLVDRSLVTAFPDDRLQLNGVAIVCGDMHNEREFFRDRYKTIRFRRVDGYDLSDVHLSTAGPFDFEFVPHLLDCNDLVLEKNKYHFVVAFHAIHHVYNVSNVFFQSNQALKDGGVMYTDEYVGPRHLQVTFTTYWICRILLMLLFSKRERTTHEGRLKGKWMTYPPGTLDPSEACNPDVIEREMYEYFEPLHILRYGGLTFPMFEGLGLNFTKDSWRFRFVIYLERALQHLGIIRPTFMQAVLRKKKVW